MCRLPRRGYSRGLRTVPELSAPLALYAHTFYSTNSYLSSFAECSAVSDRAPYVGCLISARNKKRNQQLVAGQLLAIAVW